MTIRVRLLITLALITVGTVGCGGGGPGEPVARLYAGPPRELDRVSRLVNSAAAGLVAVDGQSVVGVHQQNPALYRMYELPPGEREVVVGVIRDREDEEPAADPALRQTITHRFDPGGWYTILATIDRDGEEITDFEARIVPYDPDRPAAAGAGEYLPRP